MMMNLKGCRTGVVAAGVIAAGALLWGCDHSPAETSAVVSRPPTATGPAAQITAPTGKKKAIPKDLERIPELGAAKPLKMPDGSVWSVYPNGLRIYDLRPGQGIHPRLGQMVHVAYVGKFPDGREFDHADKEHPFVFQLGTTGIIKGWNLAIANMALHGKREIYLPPDLAYGAGGHLPVIPPNQPLIFEIELLDITGEAVDIPEAEIPEVKPLGPTTEPAKKE